MIQPRHFLFKTIGWVVFLIFPLITIAQEEEAVVDVFQEAFFESLKQKGIENYDKAIEQLQKCLELEPNNATVHYEIGRNYFFQKKHNESLQAYLKAKELQPNHKWILVGLYDVFYELKDYNQALGVINDLVLMDKKYREDQVSLYMYTKQFDKALALIKVLDEELGTSVERDAFKRQIFMDAKYREAEKEFLLAQIKKYPKKESNYISIIYLYSESNQEEMAFEMAKLLEKNIPDSEWAQVGLFKFYLNNKKIEEAVQSMTTVLKNTSINSKIKYKIINEFLIFTNHNAGYDKYLEEAIEHIDEEGTVKIAKDIGKYYQKNNNQEKAIRYFKIALENASNDLDAHLLLLQSYLKKGEFKMIAVESENLLEIYPLQPDLFYLAGMSSNKIGRFKKAKDFLESGLELIVDNPDLTINFYLQLIEACNGLGDTQCKNNYLYQSKKSLQQKK